MEELKKSLTLFATDEMQIKNGGYCIVPLIRPTTLFAFSTSHLLAEFHPDYQKYYNNIHASCMLLKR